MRKELSNGVIIEFPANKQVAFKVEGRRGYYTIIDAASTSLETYLLLEHNTYGEDDMVVVMLPHTRNPLVLERYDDGDFNVGLSKPAEFAIFISEQKIIAETYDDIITTLEDHDVFTDDIEIWSDEEINDLNF